MTLNIYLSISGLEVQLKDKPRRDSGLPNQENYQQKEANTYMTPYLRGFMFMFILNHTEV
jgi:hypothetical protein